LLDIDAIWDHRALGNRIEIIDMVEKLHDMEGAAFEALITDEARSLWGSAAIANVLAPAQNTAIDTAISQIEEIHSLKDG
jgi:hypothetical protein